jgi:uncharacterized integral membrane protein
MVRHQGSEAGADQPGAVQPAATRPENADPGTVEPEPGATPAGTATPPVPRPLPADHALKRTRAGGTWVAIACFAVLLLFLLIFILQNGHEVAVSYLGANGHVPLGVALLLAAVCGALLVVLAAMARILQLRTTARRHRRLDAKAARNAGN